MATPQPLVSCHEAERNHHALLDDFHTAEDEEDKENEPAYDELTLNTAPKDLLWHVHHLRHRLERRNAVLDAVRKAYHADIVVVREHLHRCFGGKDSPLPSSLPSLDLRPALELFAPKECELRIRPCFACGGCLEIVHRDSERIERLKRACSQFQEVEHLLRLELVETERRAHLDRLQLEKLQARVDEDRDIFISKVNKLKKWIIGYDDTRRECMQMRDAMARLESENAEYRTSLAILGETQAELTRTSEALEDHRVLLEQTQSTATELRESEHFYRESEDAWKADCHALSSTVWLLEGELDCSRERGKRLSSDLSECRLRLHITKEQLGDALDRIDCLDTTLDATQKVHIRVQSDLLAVEKEMESTIQCREREIQAKTEIIDAFIGGVGDSTRELNDIHHRREVRRYRQSSSENEPGETSTAPNPQNSESEPKVATKALHQLNEEIALLQSKVSSLTSFTSGYAGCIFDQCVSQENLLKSEGYTLEGSSRCIPVVNTAQNEDKSAVAAIRRRLDNSSDNRACDDTANIDWNTILDSEDDRRQILAHLGNRMQMGLHSLEKAFEHRGREHKAEMKQICCDHDRRLGSLRSYHEQEMSKLQTELDKVTSEYQQAEADRRRLEKTNEDLSSQLESAQSKICKQERQLSQSEGIVSNLEDRLAQSVEEVRTQQATMAKQANTITRQRADLDEKDEQIRNRNLIIDQLERLLEKTTQNFAAVVEKEQLRLETNRSVAIQARPGTSCASVAADLYVPPGLRSRPLRKDRDGEYVLSHVATERIPLPHHTEHIYLST